MNKITEIWLALIRWQGWRVFGRACGRCWLAFIHWSGWAAIGRWSGWEKILLPHRAVVMLAPVLAVAGLCWVFFGGNEQKIAAYAIYVLSFYALVILVLRMPKLLSALNRRLHKNKVTNRILTDRELRFRGKLYIKQFINLGYGGLKTIAGFLYASTWLMTDGLYNLVQGLIELVQILRRRKDSSAAYQWKSYRLSGWLMLVMHLFMTGPIFLMIYRNQGETYPDIVVIATAAFAFYKLISAFLGVAKDRKHVHPIDSAVRMMNLSQALFSLFSLQISMFHTFGGEFASQRLMNLMTGGAVSVLVISTGVYMIRRAHRELKKI